MEDEFLLYLKRMLKSRVIISFENADLLIWGKRKKTEVKLLGVTLNIGVRDLDSARNDLSQPKPELLDAIKFGQILSIKSNCSPSTVL